MSFFEIISEIFFWALVSLIWALVSIITLGGYQYLAGDTIFPLTEVNLFLGTPIAILLFITIITNILKKRFSGNYKYQMEKTSRYLSFIAMWMLLPITMNVFSIVTKLFGSTHIANLLFSLRYHSLYISIIMLISYFIIRHYIKTEKELYSKPPV